MRLCPNGLRALAEVAAGNQQSDILCRAEVKNLGPEKHQNLGHADSSLRIVRLMMSLARSGLMSHNRSLQILHVDAKRCC
jgi:hypothetical protein